MRTVGVVPSSPMPSLDLMTQKKPLTVANRNVTVRDFAIFQLKLVLDGMKDFFAIWLSIGAIILDVIAGRGRRPRLFYSVVRASERFDKWINLHSVVQRMDEEGSEDGFFGGMNDEEDTLVTEIDRLVKGRSSRQTPPGEGPPSS